jgi:phosphate transport system substrate-binding protein
MNRNLLLCFSAIIIMVAFSCEDKKKSTSFGDGPGFGNIRISADESFKPVMDEMIEAYSMLNPSANIEIRYKAESDCLRDLFYDSSVRLVIISRGLTDREDRVLTQKLCYRPGWQRIAHDAIAVIVHPNSKDTVFSRSDLKDMISGKNRDREILFDGTKATASFRYFRDSIMGSDEYDSTLVKAASGNEAVIEYVANHPGAIGLVGISWIGNPQDSIQITRLNKVKTAYIRCDRCEGTPYVKPSAESMVSGRYPLLRGMYYVIKENYKGLGTDLVSYMKFEPGQLIFRRSYLRPEMDFRVRNVKINTVSSD